jgi:uncharacterized membrane protein YqhA
VIVAVIASLISAIELFFMATADGWHMVVHLLHYASPDLTMADRVQLRGETVTHVVEMVDGYLLATFLLIIGRTLYQQNRYGRGDKHCFQCFDDPQPGRSQGTPG